MALWIIVDHCCTPSGSSVASLSSTPAVTFENSVTAQSHEGIILWIYTQSVTNLVETNRWRSLSFSWQPDMFRYHCTRKPDSSGWFIFLFPQVPLSLGFYSMACCKLNQSGSWNKCGPNPHSSCLHLLWRYFFIIWTTSSFSHCYGRASCCQWLPCSVTAAMSSLWLCSMPWNPFLSIRSAF